MSSSRNVRPRRRGPRANVVVIQPRQRGFVRVGGSYGRYSGTNPEMKFLDTVVTDAVIAAGITINQITVVPEGNGESERVGRKICVKKISVIYCLKLISSTAQGSTSDCVRVMLIQDKQTNGALFAATDLIDTDAFISFNNLANSGRFKTLFKRDYALKAGGGVATGAAFAFSEDSKTFRKTFKVTVPIEYDNTATDGTVSTVRSNNLYWVTQSSDGVSIGVGTVRIRYSDK